MGPYAVVSDTYVNVTDSGEIPMKTNRAIFSGYPSNRSHRGSGGWSRGIRALASLIAILFLAATSAAWSQRWEYDYGGACNESGRKGVRPVAANAAFGLPAGYIAVGQTNTPTVCGNTDIYVIRTDLNGVTVWEATFNIAGNDIGFDIVECAFAPPGMAGFPLPAVGDLVITGTTNGPVCAAGNVNEAFLLRIDAAGVVVKWLQTYGTAAGVERAHDLVETTTGNAAFGTAPGDLVFAGAATAGAAGPPDGYIVRANGGTGAQIWGRTYGGINLDEFRGVDEATVGVPAGFSGDILAAGHSASFGVPLQAMMVRVNGDNGLIGAAPQGTLIYGSPNFPERINAVQELTVGAEAGNIVMVGGTRGVPFGSASTNFEILVVKTGPNPCNVLLDQMYGDNANGFDMAMDFREIQGGGGGLVAGNLIITGFSNVPATVAGFGANDLFLLEVGPAVLVPAGMVFGLYGGAAADQGESVAFVPNFFGGAATAGFVVCGFETSNLAGAGDPQDLYLLKTNVVGSTNCNDNFPPVNNMPPVYPWNCPGIQPPLHGANCLLPAAPIPQAWSTLLCFINPKPGPGFDEEGTTVDMDRLGSFYPNPVREGEMLTIMFETTAGAPVNMTVANALGEIISRPDVMPGSDGGTVKVATTGWSPGVYLVTLDDGTETRTIRVTVVR